MSNRRVDRRGVRKIEALARNAAWEALPTITKIDRLHHRRGFSKHQRNRLMAPMTAKIAAKAAERAADGRVFV